MKRILSIAIILSVVLFPGCVQEKKLPAIKVVFMHYNIKGHHVLKIKKVEPALYNEEGSSHSVSVV